MGRGIDKRPVRRAASGSCTALLLAAILAVPPWGQPLQAQQVYRWVDAQGLSHFGDQPPPPGAAQREELVLPDYAEPARPPDQDPYSIMNQLQRLQEQRAALERARLARQTVEQEYELRRRELEAQQQSPVPPPIHLRPYPPPFLAPHRPFRPPYRSGRSGPYRAEGDHPAYRPPRSKPPPPLPRGRIDLGP